MSVLFCAFLCTVPCGGGSPDAWFATDKALHFAACTSIAAGGYATGTALFDGRVRPALLGGGLSVAAGAAKELWDATGHGYPSWRDFTWDLIGAATGVALAVGVDLLVTSLRGRRADVADAMMQVGTSPQKGPLSVHPALIRF